jgi:transposase-like protein
VDSGNSFHRYWIVKNPKTNVDDAKRLEYKNVLSDLIEKLNTDSHAVNLDRDLYNYEISPETVSSITDKIIERARDWQSRPVEPIYAVIYMDAVFLKMRTEGYVRSVAVYTIIGINLDGHKECLGMWICETESANYWLVAGSEIA